MKQNIELPMKDLKKIDRKRLKTALSDLAEKAKEFLIENIKEVYSINSRIRVQGNYIPLEDMIRAITIEYDANDLSFSIGVDEDKLVWKDKFGKDIYEVESGDGKNEKVKSLSDHWRTPIEGVREDDWFLSKTVDDLSSFIKKDFIKMI